MGLEERIQAAWEEAHNGAVPDGFFKLMNVPATEFNLHKVREETSLDAFLRVADRHLPSADVETEAKFKSYLDTYRRLRGSVAAGDVVAFLRCPRTPQNLQSAEQWLRGKLPFDTLRQVLSVK